MIVLNLDVFQDFAEAVFERMMMSKGLKSGGKEASVPSFIVNVVSESRGINHRQRNTHSLLLELYKPNQSISVPMDQREMHIPTVIGLI